MLVEEASKAEDAVAANMASLKQLVNIIVLVCVEECYCSFVVESVAVVLRLKL